MTRKEYNGWTNYETWAVNLWMDNEEGSYSYWRERAEEVVKDASGDTIEEKKTEATSTLADEIKDLHEEGMPEVQGVFADLLNAAMSEVNWYEIAQHLVDDVEVEEETEA